MGKTKTLAPRGSTTLKVASSFLPMNAALLDLSTGNLAGAYASFVGMGVSAILAGVDAEHQAEGKTPDYDKLGMGRVMSMAEHAVEAPGLVKSIWRTLLLQATDPANTDFEIRQSDMDLIDSLNPSDAVLILGYGVVSDARLRWIEDWRNSDAVQRLGTRASRHNVTLWLQESLKAHFPLRFVGDFAGHAIGAKVTLSNESLLVALRERAQDKGPHALFSGLVIVESWQARTRAVFEKDGVALPHGWESSFAECRDDDLVTYRLRESAERLRRLLGLCGREGQT